MIICQDSEQGVTFQVKVIPNASRNEFGGELDGRMVVRLTAAPVEDKANKLLIKFISKQLKISPSRITIVRGLHSREKTLSINGLDGRSLCEKLETIS